MDHFNQIFPMVFNEQVLYGQLPTRQQIVPIEKLLFPTTTYYFDSAVAAVRRLLFYSPPLYVARPDDFVDYLSGIRCLESDAVPFVSDL